MRALAISLLFALAGLAGGWGFAEAPLDALNPRGRLHIPIGIVDSLDTLKTFVEAEEERVGEQGLRGVGVPVAPCRRDARTTTYPGNRRNEPIGRCLLAVRLPAIMRPPPIATPRAGLRGRPEYPTYDFPRRSRSQTGRELKSSLGVPSPSTLIRGGRCDESLAKLSAAKVACLAVLLPGLVATRQAVAEEPNYQTAAGWWKELPKKWTPIGWKNHLLRFNVLFNGAIVSKPDLNGRTTKWIDRGVFLLPSPANPTDDGTTRQGWRTDHDAPVLWTEWSGSLYAGAKLSGPPARQEVFAHVPGAEDVKTGIEPLFAWVQMSVSPLARLRERGRG